MSDLPAAAADNRAGLLTQRRGVVSWQGIMAGMDTRTGPWPGRHGSVVGEGMVGSGPVAVFAEDMSVTVVISSYRNFMTHSQSTKDSPQQLNADTVLSYGVMGGLAEIPSQFVLETVVAVSPGGVNQAMILWGDILLKEYGKARYAYRGDTVMQTLGYSTDNGAFYCCCSPYTGENTAAKCVNPPPANLDYETTLLSVKEYSVTAHLPYHYILLDSWWYYKSEDGSVDVWDMRPETFPHGLESFGAKTGWKYQLHCGQKWTPETNYSTRNGGMYNFIHDDDSISNPPAVVVPDDQTFWDDLLGNKTAAGMVMYEMDWMNDQMTASPSLLKNATLGRDWLMQADGGALKAGISIQMCMALVRQIMQSTEMLSVTNARASNDYHPGGSRGRLLARRRYCCTPWVSRRAKTITGQQLRCRTGRTGAITSGNRTVSFKPPCQA
jgi:hypothetical protein